VENLKMRKRDTVVPSIEDFIAERRQRLGSEKVKNASDKLGS
jgi:hypothetical protein